MAYQIEFNHLYVLDNHDRKDHKHSIEVTLEIKTSYSYNYDTEIEDWVQDCFQIFMGETEITKLLKIRDEELIEDILLEVEKIAQQKLESQIKDIQSERGAA